MNDTIWHWSCWICTSISLCFISIFEWRSHYWIYNCNFFLFVRATFHWFGKAFFFLHNIVIFYIPATHCSVSANKHQWLRHRRLFLLLAVILVSRRRHTFYKRDQRQEPGTDSMLFFLYLWQLTTSAHFSFLQLGVAKQSCLLKSIKNVWCSARVESWSVWGRCVVFVTLREETWLTVFSVWGVSTHTASSSKTSSPHSYCCRPIMIKTCIFSTSLTNPNLSLKVMRIRECVPTGKELPVDSCLCLYWSTMCIKGVCLRW